MKNIESFLKQIGVPADSISKLISEETTSIDEIVSGFKASQRDVLKNDPEFIQPIKDEIRGAELSKIEHKVKKVFALTAEEIRDKKFDEIITIAHEKATKSSVEGADALQQKVIDLTNENKRLVDEIIPAKESEAKNAIKQFKRESIINGIIAKKSLIVAPDVVLPAVNNYLNSNFNLDVDDSGQLVVKTKNNLNPLNADGTKIITFDEILDSHLATLGVVKQSNGSPNPNPGANPKPNPNPSPEPNSKFNLVGLKKAEQNAESLKSMKVFGKE